MNVVIWSLIASLGVGLVTVNIQDFGPFNFFSITPKEVLISIFDFFKSIKKRRQFIFNCVRAEGLSLVRN